jgi:hypothetical protein
MRTNSSVATHAGWVGPVKCEYAALLFVFPKGGWPVSPGEIYSIEVHSDGGVFGWKYVVGGYSRGAASSNSKPLLQGVRSTFLFRTLGAS